MSRNLPIRVTISLVFRYIVWQFITLIINYKEIVLDNDKKYATNKSLDDFLQLRICMLPASIE